MVVDMFLTFQKFFGQWFLWKRNDIRNVRGSSHIETSSLICRVNQGNGFYLIGTTVMKELNL